MMNDYNSISEFRILGLPEKTKYGVIKQMKVIDYPKITSHLALLKKSCQKIKINILNIFMSGTDNKDAIKEFRQELKDNELVYFIRENVLGLKNDIYEIIDYMFEEYDEDLIDVIFSSDAEWDKFRKFILKLNGFTINPEDERVKPKSQLELMFDLAEKVMEEKKGNVTDFHAMYTSILVETGMTPDEINNLTINQFFSVFRRIGKFKRYETTTLFKTVDSSGKIKIIPWSTIDEINKENDDKLVKLSSLASGANIESVDFNKNKTEVITNER